MKNIQYTMYVEAEQLQPVTTQQVCAQNADAAFVTAITFTHIFE